MIDKAMLWQMDSKDFEAEVRNALEYAQAKYGESGRVFVRPEVQSKVKDLKVIADKSVTPGCVLVEIT